MQHIILVFSVTYTLQELHLYSALLYSATLLFDKYSGPQNQQSLEMYYSGRFFSLSSALEN